MPTQTSLYPLLIAHRGDISEYPENSMEAFRSAFAKGADGIELDVHLDSQKRPIVVHDYLHDSGGTYPFLEEVLKEFGNSGRLEIEIKSLDPTCIQQVKSLIDKYNPSSYEITSSIQPLLPPLRSIFPNANIGLIFRSWLIEDWMPPQFVEKWLIGHLKLVGANILHLELEMYSKKLVQSLKRAGFKTHVHLRVADKGTWQKILELDVDQCTFDDIKILRYRDS